MKLFYWLLAAGGAARVLAGLIDREGQVSADGRVERAMDRFQDVLAVVVTDYGSGSP